MPRWGPLSHMTPIDRFIRRWQRNPWTVATLPRELGAVLTYFPSSRSELGYCYVVRRGSVVAINNGLVDTPFLIPVIAHECAHLLLGERGLHACARNHQEPEVWALAARLAVPEAVCESIRADSICSADVARRFNLPTSFVQYAAFGDALLPAFLAELDA